MKPLIVCIASALALGGCGPDALDPDTAIDCQQCDSWNQPFDPFRIHGNTWYVGVEGLTAILVEAGDDLILMDGGLPQSAALIEGNIRELGFDPLDVAAIFVSHAHFDHAGGVAAMQRLSGATVYSSVEGAKALRRGALQPDDPQFGYGSDDTGFPAIENVVAVDDGAIVAVGDVEITAVYTPGHTPGSVSWTWESCALGDCFDVVYADSLTAVSAPGYSFAASQTANQLVESAGVLSELDCDILLSPHPFFFGLQDKLQRADKGNPFINDVGCLVYADTGLAWLERRLRAESQQDKPQIVPDISPPGDYDDIE